eukprot:c29394_g1_i2 orf=541-4356(-)
MGRYPDGPTACSADPSCRVRIHSLRDVAPIIIFSFWGFVVLACSIFQLLRWWWVSKHSFKPVIVKKADLPTNLDKGTGLSKAAKVAHADKNKKNNESEVGEEVLVNMEGEWEIQITGYKNSAFGEFCFYLCCIVSVHWIALFILILFDTYNKCEVGGIDNLCFYGNHIIFGTYDFNATVFFVVWWLAAIWFALWVANKGKVHNWFRLPCQLSEANVVYVWAVDQREILSVNVILLVHVVRRIKNGFFPARGHYEIIAVQCTENGQHWFLFQGHRYLICGDSLERTHFQVGVFMSDFHKCNGGLTTEEAEKRLELVGPNEIPFKVETLLYTISAELFTLFHVYQLLMYLLWFWNSYLFVATLMSIIVILSAAITIYTRRHMQLTIAKITEYVTEAEVLRSGTWVTLDSRNLVPGDLVKVRSSWLLPCDLLITQGSCICDESGLTGEPVPVQKCFAPNSLDVYAPEGNGIRHTLFSGTTILQAGASDNAVVQAVVTATGVATSKGELLSAILYPEKLLFKYDEELPIVVTLLLLYAIVCFTISIIFQDHTGAQSIWVTKWNYCMAIINQIMSPLLPVALEVGQLHAVERLKKRGIYCLNPKRIAIVGKIRVFCFDKTGTLTKEGLDFLGIQNSITITGDEPSFGPLLSLGKGDDVGTLSRHGLASCHAVSKFGAKYVGNEVEVKMFQAVGWELEEGTDGPDVVHDGMTEKLKIVKRHEFDHARSTMSVIVEDTAGAFHAYCKGSFEKLQELSSQDSLPKDYLEVARSHALSGCYVLALGYRSLGSGVALDDLTAIHRDELEKDLKFIALILFRNELKPESRDAIMALKEGEVRPVMVTGDNAQCGHYIAKECGMVASHVQVFLGDIGSDYRVLWVPMDTYADGTWSALTTQELLQQHGKGLEGGLIELAITGKAFNVLRTTELMERLLLFTRIFARFTPTDKVLAAKMHRDCGLIVGMCGDGGNDCGALRISHAGIALSEAEASVVSHFTSKDKSVTSVVDLICEGRGALHTSFACYKFLIMYGLMFSVFKLYCYWYGIIVCQMDYLFIDGVAVLILGYAMTRSHPENTLAKARPTSSLLGPINVSSVLGIWLINQLFLIGAMILMENYPGYVAWPAKFSHGASWWTLGDNWESTVLFFTMYLQFITSAVAFSFGFIFRKHIFHNRLLVGCYGGIILLMSLVLLLPSSGFTALWHVASEQFNRPNTTSPVWIAYQEHGGSISSAMPFDFRLKLLLLIFGGLATVIIWQKILIEGPIARAFSYKFPTRQLQFWM